MGQAFDLSRTTSGHSDVGGATVSMETQTHREDISNAIFLERLETRDTLFGKGAVRQSSFGEIPAMNMAIRISVGKDSITTI
jgi:hypothetical protein